MDEGYIGEVEAASAVGQIPLVVLIRCPVDGDSAGIEGPLGVIDDGADDPAMLDPRGFMIRRTPSSTYSTLVVSSKRSATARRFW
jgi:hypothetical protein